MAFNYKVNIRFLTDGKAVPKAESYSFTWIEYGMVIIKIYVVKLIQMGIKNMAILCFYITFYNEVLRSYSMHQLSDKCLLW